MLRLTATRSFHKSAASAVARASPEVDSIIRVDHAGELGADRIYAGQMAVLGNSKMGPLIQHMWDQEKVHKATFETLIQKYRVRPTALVPVWNVAGFLLGAGTALMGEKAAMACTVAVEAVIVEHYNDQLRSLMADPHANKELMDTIQKFRDEEQEHHDTGLDHGAEQAPMYKALTEAIKVGCKTAIAISKVLSGAPTLPSQLGIRNYSTTSTFPQPTEKWDLFSGIAVERKPKLTREFTDLEKSYVKMLADIEFERSHKSNHEVQHEKELKVAEELKQASLKDLDVDLDSALKITAQDLEDSYQEDLNKFTFASRESETDVKSINRKLDSHLLLVVKETIGEKPQWILPHGRRVEGETMRATAERVLREKCGLDLKATFLGNAPCGFYKYRYPKDSGEASVGAKVFFFKALHTGGQVQVQGEGDYQWSTRQELSHLITHEKYLKNVKMFLVDEDEEEVR